LKPTEQCILAARKAQSVLAMIKRQFKIIGKEDFGIRPTSDNILSIVYRHGHQSYRRIKYYCRKYKEEQLEWSKDSRSCHKRPG